MRLLNMESPWNKMIPQAFLFVILALANVCDGRARHAGPSGSSSSKGGAGTFSGGAIAGLVCGVLAAAALVAILILLKAGVLQKWCRNCRRSSGTGSDATIKYAADANVAGDSSGQHCGLTAPSIGVANIISSSSSYNNSDSNKQEDDSGARYRGCGPPPSYDHVVRDSAQSPYSYRAAGEYSPVSSSSQQQTYPGKFTGGLAYSEIPGSGLPYTSNPGSGLPYTANQGSGLPYAANPGSGLPYSPGSGLPYTASPGSGLPYTTSPGSGLPSTANPGSGLPYSANFDWN